MKQTRGNGNKKLNLEPVLACLAQIWYSKFFFLWALPLIDVIHCCKLSLHAISRKTNEPNFKKWQKKPSFRPILVPLTQMWAPKIIFYGLYLYSMLGFNASYHCMQFQGKLINQPWENGRKPSFRPDFGPFWPKFGPQNFF